MQFLILVTLCLLTVSSWHLGIPCFFYVIALIGGPIPFIKFKQTMANAPNPPPEYKKLKNAVILQWSFSLLIVVSIGAEGFARHKGYEFLLRSAFSTFAGAAGVYCDIYVLLSRWI